MANQVDGCFWEGVVIHQFLCPAVHGTSPMDIRLCFLQERDCDKYNMKNANADEKIGSA